MIRNSSYKSFPFYLVATPIGNLDEFSPRAINILNEVDFICVEDTRTSGLLLNHFGIKKKLISVHKFNEVSKIDEVINRLKNNEKGAFLSDAGYPLISDPGNPLVNALINNGFAVSVINGPSALLPALIGSGFDTSSFIFLGFLSSSNKAIENQLKPYLHSPSPLIFYEAPHRLNKTIATLYKFLGERRITLARELTKLHEEYIYTTFEDYLKAPLETLKGEFVIVIEGSKNVSNTDLSSLLHKVDLLVEKKYSVKDAINLVSLLFDVAKNTLYEAYIKNK